MSKKMYNLEEIKKNRIVVKCPDIETTVKLRSTLHNKHVGVFPDYDAPFYVFYVNDERDPAYMDCTGEKYFYKLEYNATQTIDFDQVIFENMSEKIVGYKLKHEYNYLISSAEKIGNFCNWSALESDKEYNWKDETIAELKKAGVLDIWFEPVYKSKIEEFKINEWVFISSYPRVWASLCNENCPEKEDFPFIGQITKIKEVVKNGYTGAEIGNFGWDLTVLIEKGLIRKATPEEIEIGKIQDQKRKIENVSVGDKFTVQVKGNKKVFHGRDEDITDFVKEMIHFFSPLEKHIFGKYSAIIKDVTFSRTGCQEKETKLSDWMHVYNMIKD
jgi:hypothetical protein